MYFIISQFVKLIFSNTEGICSRLDNKTNFKDFKSCSIDDVLEILGSKIYKSKYNHLSIRYLMSLKSTDDIHNLGIN